MLNDPHDDTTPPWAEPFPLSMSADMSCPMAITASRRYVDQCELEKAIELLSRLYSLHPSSNDFQLAARAAKQFVEDWATRQMRQRGLA